MKFITLLLSLFAVSVAARGPTYVSSKTAALNVRGGGELGPLDAALAMKLSKTAATAYVAGSASKYIASQTGGSSGQIADYVTTDLFAQNALCTAIACALFGLNDTGFSDIKLLAALSVAGVVLRLDSDGLNLDTVKANKVQTLLALVLSFVAFVN